VDVDPQDLDDKEQDWLCIPPRGFEWVLPSGKIMPIIGDPIYVSAFGEYLSRNDYLQKYKVDPEIAYEYMRKKRNPPTAIKEINRVIALPQVRCWIFQISKKSKSYAKNVIISPN
jgi:hypothetical protein